MTPQQAIDNIAIYSALHNGVLDESIKVIDKHLKALEIIKNKKVEVSTLCWRIGFYTKNCDNALMKYNEFVSEEYQLTQEEYDLLKEVLWKD